MILLPLTYGKNLGFPQDKTSSYVHKKIILSKTWNGILPVTVKFSLLGGIRELLKTICNMCCFKIGHFACES